MPGSAADTSRGLTVGFGTSNWTANITSVQHTGISREAVETTHLGSSVATSGTYGGKTYVASDLQDPGEIQIEGHLDTALSAADSPELVSLVAETVTITLPQTGSETAAKEAASGFCTSFEWNAGGYDELITFTATIKLTGLVTVTDAV